MAIYVKYDGIPGDATAESHPEWITIHSCSFGIGRGLHVDVGSGENREASVCSVSEISFTKEMDKATGPLWQALCANTDGKDVQIDFTSTAEGSDNTFMYVKLNNTLVSGMSFSSAGDRPQESISISFTKIEVKYMEQAITGTEATGGSGATYDIAKSTLV